MQQSRVLNAATLVIAVALVAVVAIGIWLNLTLPQPTLGGPIGTELLSTMTPSP
jgi:hypothetical protein